MLGTSWKTTLAGILVILITAAGPVLQNYVPVQGLNWNVLMTSIAGVLGGAGLILAKDKNVTGGTTDSGDRPITPPKP